MIEFIAPLAVGALGLIPKFTKKNERAKIEQVFKNIGFGLKENGAPKFPHFLKKHETEFMRRYVYKLPNGLVIHEKLAHILSNTLNTPVEVDGDNIMSIWVAKRNLPKKWNYTDMPHKDGWVVPIGKSYKGMTWHDFDKIPHMTVAGATTWGKTVFMKMMFTHLIESHPDDARFYILDLKGGLAFHKYSKLKQVETVAEDIKTSVEALKQVKRDAEQDREYLKSIEEENAIDAGVSKRNFIIIDEAGELVPHKSMSDKEKANAKECQQLLSYIARVSGQLGYKMIYSTQYPTADIMDRQIKANSSAKVAFRLETSTQSGVALDMPGAEKLEFPGRAIYKTVEAQHVQTPFIDKEEMWKRIGRYRRDDNAETSAENVEGRKNHIHFR